MNHAYIWRGGGGVGLAGLAMFAAISAMDGLTSREPRPVRYHKFCGPPHPTTRQQRRNLYRQAAKALAALTPTKDTSQ